MGDGINIYQFDDTQRVLLEKLRIPFAVYQFIEKRVVSLIISDGLLDLFGYQDREEARYVMDHDMYRDTHPDDRARAAEAAVLFAKEGGTYDVIYRSKTAKREGYSIIHSVGEHVFQETGERLAYVCYTDEGEYAEDDKGGRLNRDLKNSLYAESLLQENNYDFLTGLPGMTYFFELAEAEKAKNLQNGNPTVLLFADLSGMKFFNNLNGFSEGNRLITAFSRLLVRYFGTENCSRFGQDHFAIITQEEDIEATLLKLFEDSRQMNGGKSLPIRVGIYQNRLEDADVPTACDRAKIACDALRNTFVSGFKYFNRTLSEGTKKKQYIIANLDKAIREKWITVYYQPIVRAISGKVCDEEALARWIDPVNGFLSPADFIPFLEEAGLIYKMDLCILDQVLEKIKKFTEEGIYVVPQSLNLSRSDFDSCDIVEEIRRRVDAAGVSRDKITIEITESIIGGNLEFMKAQVDRFQKLGFQVWMDDFGSGYSSMDVLQSIPFNLIKFDMRFMDNLDNGENGKIIVTELMRMATALGVDTVCEGVETKQQVRFLQEIGCSKLQGYYYDKPNSLDTILKKLQSKDPLGFENPQETSYFETIGRVNLYDLTVITEGDTGSFHNYFNTLPMAILEVENEKIRVIRSNQSYREFLNKRFAFIFSGKNFEEDVTKGSEDTSFMELIKQCCQTGNRAFLDEKMADGSTVHSFARRVGINPVTGNSAVAVVVLSITDQEK